VVDLRLLTARDRNHQQLAAPSSGWIAFESWHSLTDCTITQDCAGRVVVGLNLTSNYNLTLPATPQIDVMTLGHSRWALVPMLGAPASKFALLGEVGKVVHASSRRFSSIKVTGSGKSASFVVGVSLAVDEVVVVATYHYHGNTGGILWTECNSSSQPKPMAHPSKVHQDLPRFRSLRTVNSSL